LGRGLDLRPFRVKKRSSGWGGEGGSSVVDKRELRNLPRREVDGQGGKPLDAGRVVSTGSRQKAFRRRQLWNPKHVAEEGGGRKGEKGGGTRC